MTSLDSEGACGTEQPLRRAGGPSPRDRSRAFATLLAAQRLVMNGGCSTPPRCSRPRGLRQRAVASNTSGLPRGSKAFDDCRRVRRRAAHRLARDRLRVVAILVLANARTELVVAVPHDVVFTGEVLTLKSPSHGCTASPRRSPS